MDISCDTPRFIVLLKYQKIEFINVVISKLLFFFYTMIIDETINFLMLINENSVMNYIFIKDEEI